MNAKEIAAVILEVRKNCERDFALMMDHLTPKEQRALLACARMLVERGHTLKCSYQPNDSLCTCGLREIADALDEGGKP